MGLPRVTIYSDGGCNPNPGPGGWGAVIIASDGSEKELSGGHPETTNNRMELTAVTEALNALVESHHVKLYVDSQYVKKGITQWLPGWIRSGWRTSTGSTVKNQDLWEALSQAVKRHEIEWRWVKGHAGDTYNERVDQLATAAQPERKTVALSDDKLVAFIRVAVPKNDGPGGWAIRIWDGKESSDYSGRVPKVPSANAMELMAAFQIFKSVPKDAPLQIYCPSDYLFKGMTEWIGGWKKRSWKTSSGGAVKNVDSWRSIDEAASSRIVDWVWEQRDNSPAISVGLDKVAKEALNR